MFQVHNASVSVFTSPLVCSLQVWLHTAWQVPLFIIHALCLSVENWARQVPPTFSVCLWEHQRRSGERGSDQCSVLPSQAQAVGQGLQLLLSQPLLLLQVFLPDEQRGLGPDEVPVVLQLLGGHLAGQEGGDHALSPVQVILQIFGVLPLFAQQTVAAVQGLLSTERSLVIENSTSFSCTLHPCL